MSSANPANAAAAQALANRAAGGSPLDVLMQQFGQQEAMELLNLLMADLQAGINPRQIAREMSGKLDELSYGRAETIARTESLGSWNDAALENYRANSDVVGQWMWMCEPGAGTCVSCLEEDGTIYDLDEELDDHPNGRCCKMPVTNGYGSILDEYGIPWEEGDFGPAPWEDRQSGEDWLLAQDAETQRAAFGSNAAFTAWLSGDVSLADFVGIRHDAAWGDSIYQKSLRSMGKDAKDYGKGSAAEKAVEKQVAQEAAPKAATEGLAPAKPYNLYADIERPLSTYGLTAEDRAFAASLRDQIPEGGIMTHDDAIVLGKQIHDRVTNDLAEMRSWVDEFGSIKERSGLNLTEAETAWIRGDPEAIAAHGGLRVTEVEGAYRDAYQAQIRAYLGDVRELGGVDINFATDAARFNEDVAGRIESATQFIPSDWLRASNDLGRITPMTTGRGGIGGYLRPNLNGNATLTISGANSISPRFLSAGQSTALHEMMHRMEQTFPAISDIERQFYEMRTAGDVPVPLTNGMEWTTKLDQWRDEYLGREPFGLNRPEITLPDGTIVTELDTYELLTMGAEAALAPGVTADDFLLFMDDEYAAFVLGVLFGVHAPLA